MSSTEDDEQRRRRLEEALEVKSLRRIISAYLNYPEAAEEDIRRYERCFRKLSLGHKALVPHLPLKYQKLRWCVSQNSYFIFEMLKAFEPPIDMSADADISRDQSKGNPLDNHLLSVEVIPPHSGLESGKLQMEEADKTGKGVIEEHNSIKPGNAFEEKSKESLRKYEDNHSMGSKCSEQSENPSSHVCQSVERSLPSSSMDCCDGHVSSSPPDWLDPSLQYHVPLADVDKVRCIIRNIVRDWASEGQKERDECFKPILEELERLFPNRSERRHPPACLVPGAGLGRLALEISCLGFISQGNEFSYYMMICSSFILNNCQMVEEWTIYPWIHSNCNSLSDNDQLRPVSIPDIHPASAGITEGFSMCGGDFVEVYSEPIQVGVWDAVVTCFFIDTAHNVIEYIEIISKILKDGGVWINLGPLLYHFSEMCNPEDEMSIELNLEDVKRVAYHYGFVMERESTIATTYSTNPKSMMKNWYYAAFWTMRKKPSAATKE